MKKYDLTHARHDPAHCLAPGLFRSLKRGERKHAKLDITYHHGDESIRFWGPEPLGADDLRILQGLVAMAGPAGLVLTPEPETAGGSQLRLALDTKWDSLQQDALVIKGSYRSLAGEVGYTDTDGGSTFKAMRKVLERLWSVSVIVEKAGRRQGFRILSEYESDEQDGRLFVALNPRIAQAIMGTSRHIRIRMDEVRSLKTDPARIIHQRLCAWINEGSSGKVETDTVCGYIWPDTTTNTNTLKKRRQTARKALAELATVGWTASEYASGKWEIKRPPA